MTVEMGSIGHHMNSQEQSKAVDEAIHQAIHDYVEGQATTNLFMAAEKNVRKFLKEYRQSLNKTDQERGERRPSTRRVHFDMGSMDTAEACSRGAVTDQSRSHLTPSTRPTRLVETAEGQNNESPSTASSPGLGGPDSRSPEKQADRSQDQQAEERIIDNHINEDPQSAFQGMAPPDADKLRAQEANKMNAERQAAHRSREKARCLVNASGREVAKEVDDSPSPRTAKEAEEGKRPLNSQAAVECWRACKEDSQNKSSSCGASKMEHAPGLNSEKRKLEETVDGNSYANSDHQPHTEELQKDAQDPAPGVQQNKILGSTDSPSDSA